MEGGMPKRIRNGVNRHSGAKQVTDTDLREPGSGGADLEEGKEQVHGCVSVLVLVQLQELSLWGDLKHAFWEEKYQKMKSLFHLVEESLCGRKSMCSPEGRGWKREVNAEHQRWGGTALVKGIDCFICEIKISISAVL